MTLTNIGSEANLWFPLDMQNTKGIHLQGPLPPRRLTGDSAPWTPAGGSVPAPRYRLALRARHGLFEPCQGPALAKASSVCN